MNVYINTLFIHNSQFIIHNLTGSDSNNGWQDNGFCAAELLLDKAFKFYAQVFFEPGGIKPFDGFGARKGIIDEFLRFPHKLPGHVGRA